MPTEEEISLSQQSLYDSAALRDDLNDAEATILLTWGEGQLARLAKDYPDDFEQKSRFLRQVIKGINRFVGQREFNEIEAQRDYLKKVTMYFEQLGWERITDDVILAAIPADKKDMLGTLRAILALLSPAAANPAAGPTSPVLNPATVSTSSSTAVPEAKPSLGNPNDTGINHDDSNLNKE